MSGIEVHDPGDLRKYRTEVPNLIFDLGLSPHAGWLYGHLKRTCGPNGKCWKATKTLAKEAKMSAGKVSEARQELEEAKLISIERPDNPKNPVEVTITDIWLKNFEHFARVQNMKASCSEYEPKNKPSSKNSRRDADASLDIMNNPFGYYCEVAKALRVKILPEDRNQTSKHFKDLVRLDMPTEEEIKRVVSKMLEARTAGIFWSPQKALEKVRGNNVTPLRPVEPARPKKRVIS
jgi:hypothetical protein